MVSQTRYEEINYILRHIKKGLVFSECEAALSCYVALHAFFWEPKVLVHFKDVYIKRSVNKLHHQKIIYYDATY